MAQVCDGAAMLSNLWLVNKSVQIDLHSYNLQITWIAHKSTPPTLFYPHPSSSSRHWTLTTDTDSPYRFFWICLSQPACWDMLFWSWFLFVVPGLPPSSWHSSQKTIRWVGTGLQWGCHSWPPSDFGLVIRHSPFESHVCDSHATWVALTPTASHTPSLVPCQSHLLAPKHHNLLLILHHGLFAIILMQPACLNMLFWSLS